jgi:hypothetical protein
MAQCFCGCGRKARFGMRAVNKRGSIINGDLATVRTLTSRGLKSPTVDVFIHDGDLLLAVLAEAVHAGVDPGPELEHETRGFMRFGHRAFGTAALGSAIRRSGMTSDEAIAAIAAGEWDPFEDVEIPR